MEYIDGFVVAVPNQNKRKYIQHAREAAAIFKEYGALRLVECWGDEVPEGELTSFPIAVKCEPDETVVFSWISWPSKAVHDVGMAKFMKDPRITGMMMEEMPFDGKRMIYGGFQMIVDE